MERRGMLVILSGPSGSGKDTVIEKLIENDSNIVVSVSATTREKRESEIDGKSYYFVSNEEFERMISDNELLEYEKYNNCYYGTPLKPVNELLSQGKTVILKIEVKGAANIMKMLGEEVTSVFLLPPSFEELRRRLESRNTETPEQLQNRLDIACEEIKYAENYEYTVINDDLSVAVSDILTIFKSESKKTKRNLDVIREVSKDA